MYLIETSLNVISGIGMNHSLYCGTTYRQAFNGREYVLFPGPARSGWFFIGTFTLECVITTVFSKPGTELISGTKDVALRTFENLLTRPSHLLLV